MTDPAVLAATAAADERLTALLRAVGEHDATAGPLDSAMLGHCLGWSAPGTAASVEDAKRRLLVWAIRVGGIPVAGYEEIELTVQGRRRLATAAIATDP